MTDQQPIPENQFQDMLNAFLETRFPSAKEAAEHYGISRQYISYITKGQKPANKDMLSEMGYKRFKVAFYQRIDDPNAEIIEENDFVSHVVAYMDAHFESYPKAGKHYDMSRQYMSNIVNGDKPPNKAILDDMGFRRWKEAFYIPVDKDSKAPGEQAA